MGQRLRWMRPDVYCPMRIGLIFALTLAAIATSNGQQQRKLKVLISVPVLRNSLFTPPTP